MGGIVELRADDTIRPMQTAQSSGRRNALESWVDGVLAAAGERVEQEWQALLGDASFRHFYRVHTHTRTLIAMDAPPTTENNAQFVRLSKVFHDAGVRVPEVVASDVEQGFLLVSDLGELMYSTVYGTDEHDAAIDAAFDTMIEIARIGDANGVVPPYTRQRLHDELELFIVWFLDGLLRRSLTKAERGMLDKVWPALIDCIDGQNKVCVHRDFHSRNLLWGPDRVTRVVDFQDALHGPVLYDIASLLRDCYFRFDEAEIARWREHYRTRATAAGLPMPADAIEFARQLDLTAMQRQLKAIGIFARLELRDGRPSHLVDIEPVLDHLIDVAGSYPDFARFGEWLAMIRPALRVALAARGVQCAE
jgi:aminoglycoside/choline kinase family phosphotransferase